MSRGVLLLQIREGVEHLPYHGSKTLQEADHSFSCDISVGFWKNFCPNVVASPRASRPVPQAFDASITTSSSAQIIVYLALCAQISVSFPLKYIKQMLTAFVSAFKECSKIHQELSGDWEGFPVLRYLFARAWCLKTQLQIFFIENQRVNETYGHGFFIDAIRTIRLPRYETSFVSGE